MVAASAPRIAIIGGGFSGTLILANIVRDATQPLIIDWFEEKPRRAQGVAYSTKDNVHLLNVPAMRMGAFGGKPTHFLEWLQSEQGRQAVAAIWPGNEIQEGSFVPRAVFAVYLKSILDEALVTAASKHIMVNQHGVGVEDMVLSGGQLAFNGFEFDALVLATGNQPPRRFAFEDALGNDPRYVGDIWELNELFLAKVKLFAGHSTIVIIGTGLTAVDAILTLKKQGYQGKVIAISRNGLFPTAHAPAKPYPAWEWVQSASSAPAQAFAMLVRLRQEIKKAAKDGYDWRAVIDSLRPVTPTLWKQLPTHQKRVFLRRLMTLWNIHRHRMATFIGQQIEALRSEGMLTVLAGKILDVKTAPEGLSVSYKPRGEKTSQTITAALVLNCTGPDYNIAASDSKLLRQMHARGLLKAHELNVGIALDGNDSAAGDAKGLIFPVGPLLVGERLECTAVPELREQASATAKSVLARLKA